MIDHRPPLCSAQGRPFSHDCLDGCGLLFRLFGGGIGGMQAAYVPVFCPIGDRLTAKTIA